MLKRTFLKTSIIALAAAALPLSAPAADEKRTGYAEVNGLKYYYEITGAGEPLLVLHGGLGSIGMFNPVLPNLSATRQVIAVDLHGHGRTALGDRNIKLEDIGDDMAAILKLLNVDQTDVLGYSFGGGVAFRLAVQHPDMVRRLALVSAGYASDGFYAEMRKEQAKVAADMAPMMKDSPMYTTYASVAPNPDEFPKLLDQMGNWMRGDYDWAADAPKLKMPVMLVYADADMYRPEHEIKFYQLLGGGLKDAGWMRETMSQNRLAIIPNRTHYDIFFAPELEAAVLPFLNGVTKVKTFEEQMATRK
jgi:pimeloyl-ACP methyl ester carboxylesterase